MDIGSIAAAVSSLKTAGDIAQAMVGVRDTAIMQTKTIELQGAILTAQSSAITAQSEQFSLLERIRELEEKVAQAEAWATEKHRYKLNNLDGGGFTYVLKEEESTTEPVHQLCANCFDVHKRKSILQTEHYAVGRAEALFCHKCGFEFYVRGSRIPEHGPRRKPAT